MEDSKEIRWKQFFENFEKVYRRLEQYQESMLESELEIAGYIHYFEMTMEHANKVIDAYLDAKGIKGESAREAIRKMAELSVIKNERIWYKVQNRRNLPFYIHDEKVANELVRDIDHVYFPEIKSFYHQLCRER